MIWVLGLLAVAVGALWLAFLYADRQTDLEIARRAREYQRSLYGADDEWDEKFEAFWKWKEEGDNE